MSQHAEEASRATGMPAYLMLGQKSKALADFMRAIELGLRVPQKELDMCR